VVAIDRFGASAPDSELAELFGMTVARVVERASALLDQG
jgi:transketolase